jgi:DNA-binding CsgD family transcriptional regulator
VDASAASALCREGLAQAADRSAEGIFHLCLAQASFAGAQLEEARRAAGSAAASPGLSIGQRAQAAAWASLATASLGAASRVAELATDALGSAYADRDHLARAMAAAAAAVSKHLSGDYGSARDGLDAAIAAADASPSRAAHRFPLHYHRGLLALDADSSGEVDDAIRRGRKISEELGTLGAVPLYHWLAGLRLFWKGQWDEAVVELDGGLAVAESVGTRNGVVLAHSLKALVAVHRGDVAQARAKLGDAEAEHARTGAQYRHHWALLARAQVAGAAGDGGHALAAVTTAWDACQAAGAKSELAVVGPELARLAAAAGDATTPGRVAASLGALSATNSWVASLAGAALLCRGLADDDPEALCEAVVAYQRSGRVLDTALAAEDAGVALGRTGRLDAAMSVLDQAWNAYDGLGSWRGRARVDARYRALGLRRGPRGMRPRARTGWDALTETERRIASLVAEGCSNPQIAERLFVSRGTVKSHVSHVLAKIGVRSRVELAVEAARRAPPSR